MGSAVLTMIEIFTPAIDRFLWQNTVMSLAVYADEMLWAANVFYCLDDHAPRLLYYTEERTLHGRLSAHNPVVVATIAPQMREVARIQGVQLSGTTRMLHGDEAADARRMFAAAFPKVGEAQAPIWALTPQRVKMVNNGVAFGHRELWPQQ